MNCFCKSLYLYITFTQSLRLEEAIPDSYDKCEPSLYVHCSVLILVFIVYVEQRETITFLLARKCTD